MSGSFNVYASRARVGPRSPPTVKGNHHDPCAEGAGPRDARGLRRREPVRRLPGPGRDPQEARPRFGREGCREGAKADKAALSSKPQLVASFGAWGAYEAQGPKSKICYALAQPKERTPSSLKRDAGYIFISTRPGEHVRNEVSVIMGLPLKEGSGDAKAEVGTTNFDLVTKGQNAWMKDSTQEGQLVGAMKKHARLVVKAPSSKGAVATDSLLAERASGPRSTASRRTAPDPDPRFDPRSEARPARRRELRLRAKGFCRAESPRAGAALVSGPLTL